MNKIQINSRLKALEISKRIGGIHFGGIFSIIDFYLSLYSNIKSNYLDNCQENINNYYHGISNNSSIDIIMSKGHCYLAQLIALDMVFNKNMYTDLYMKEINFCGHPKKNINNFHFKVSSGSLGQGVTVASGIAYAEKLKNSNKIISVVLGDGELNEGCVIESLRCAATLSLPIIFILDDNNQISLDKNLLSFYNHLDFCNSINIKYIEINGNDFLNLNELYFNIFTSQIISPIFIRLKTIKGYGVSFMEKNYNWHHRRPKNNEIEMAIHELSELL